MGQHETTCWTIIRDASNGSADSRDMFARRYRSAIEAYLRARWGGRVLLNEIDDAVQEVFVECFRDGGALSGVEQDRPGGFRAFLYGVCRNVALRTESRVARKREQAGLTVMQSTGADATEEHLSQVFDREWARSIMRQAAVRQSELAESVGPEAVRRVELLRLRFQEGKPIREIAADWSDDPEHLHREYAKARKEFKSALFDVILFHRPGSAEHARQECARLLGLLG